MLQFSPILIVCQTFELFIEARTFIYWKHVARISHHTHAHTTLMFDVRHEFHKCELDTVNYSERPTLSHPLVLHVHAHRRMQGTVAVGIRCRLQLQMSPSPPLHRFRDETTHRIVDHCYYYISAECIVCVCYPTQVNGAVYMSPEQFGVDEKS